MRKPLYPRTLRWVARELRRVTWRRDAEQERDHHAKNNKLVEAERGALRNLIGEFADYCVYSGMQNLGEELRRKRDAIYDGSPAVSAGTTVTSGFPPFGVDPSDSVSLLKLRESIDAADVWPSAAAKESGDYEAAVEFMARRCRSEAATQHAYRRKLHNQRTELNRMERALAGERRARADTDEHMRGAAAVAADGWEEVGRHESALAQFDAWLTEQAEHYRMNPDANKVAGAPAYQLHRAFLDVAGKLKEVMGGGRATEPVPAIESPPICLFCDKPQSAVADMYVRGPDSRVAICNECMALSLFKRTDCWCHKCNPDQAVFATRMIVCPTCGNKRCPKASNHELACMGSNEPGQAGSVHGRPTDSDYMQMALTPTEPESMAYEADNRTAAKAVLAEKTCAHCGQPITDIGGMYSLSLPQAEGLSFCMKRHARLWQEANVPGPAVLPERKGEQKPEFTVGQLVRYLRHPNIPQTEWGKCATVHQLEPVFVVRNADDGQLNATDEDCVEAADTAPPADLTLTRSELIEALRKLDKHGNRPSFGLLADELTKQHEGGA